MILSKYDDLGPVTKSPLDPNAYQVIRLKNGLKVLLISTCRHGLDLDKPPGLDKRLCVYNALQNFNEKLNIPKEDATDEIPSAAEAPQEINNPQNGNIPPGINTQKPKANPRKHCCRKSCASGNEYVVTLVVNSGMFEDGARPGMAHFVEHIIMMSSSRYPEPEGFTRFVQENDGDYSASTLAESTTFSFFISKDKIEIALNYFVDLVVNTLFNNQQVRAELNSIESEFWNRWTSNEENQYIGLLHYFGSDGHPFSKYGLGNRSFLDVPNITKLSKDWKNRRYVATNMVVTIQGPDKLQRLAKLATKYFMTIPSGEQYRMSNRDLLFQKFHPDNYEPFDKAKWNRCYHIIPYSPGNSIRLCWYLKPNFGSNHATKPLEFISYLLSMQSKGSLIYYLRQKGWILATTSISPRASHFATMFCSLYCLKIQLTELGFRYKSDVIKSVFVYLWTLYKAPSSKLRRIFKEIQQFHADVFHFRSDYNIMDPGNAEEFEFTDPDMRGEIMAVFSHYLLDNDSPAEIFTSRLLTTRYDETIIRQALEHLANPDNCNCILASKSFEKKDDDEIWYGIRFSSHDADYINGDGLYGIGMEKILGESINRFLGHAVQDMTWWGTFFLPDKNKFIERSQCFPIPIKERKGNAILEDSDKLYFQYSNDNCRRGELATCSYIFEMETEIASWGPTKGLFLYPRLNLFVECLKLIYEEEVSAALSSAIRLEIELKGNILNLFLSGPSSKLPELFQQFISTFANIEDKLKKSPYAYSSMMEYRILSKHQALHISESYLEYLTGMVLRKYNITLTEYQEFHKSEEFMFHNFLTFVQNLKKQMYITVRMEGCLRKRDVVDIHNYMKETLNYDPMPSQKSPIKERARLKTWQLTHALELPFGERCFRIMSNNLMDPHHWVRNFYQVWDSWDNYDLYLEILEGIIHHLNTEAYMDLRISRQIGYLVDVLIEYYPLGILVTICGLSSRFTPDFIDEQIDSFLSNIYHNTIRNKKRFDEVILPYFEEGSSVTQRHVIKFFNKFLLPPGREFRKLSFQVMGYSDMTPRENRPPRSGRKLANKIRKYNSDNRRNVRQMDHGNEFEFPKENIPNQENGYFITNLRLFKAHLRRI